MEKFNYKKEMLMWVLLIIPFVYLGYVWSSLSELVPIHFGADGTPNGWGDKYSELLLPAINVFTYFLLLFVPLIDPKKMNGPFFQNNFFKIRVVLVLFFSVFSVFVIHLGLPGAHNEAHWLPAGIFLLLAILGNFMINLKPNWFVGIRTPWTISSDTVWKKTHLVGGRLWFYGGLLCFALSFFVKGEWLTTMMGGFALGSTAFVIIYSFWLYKMENNQTTKENSQ